MMRPESVEQEGVHPRPLQQALNSQEDFPPLQHSVLVPRNLPQDAEETSLSESEDSSCQQENIVNRSNHTEMQSKSDAQMPSDMSMDDEEADITAVNTVAEKEKRGEKSGMRQKFQIYGHFQACAGLHTARIFTTQVSGLCTGLHTPAHATRKSPHTPGYVTLCFGRSFSSADVDSHGSRY
ncbi:hypothetical protein Bbelb_391390 [Branchiostoma belcheri]|nr:hypothetical protein Bbelb_391390 [Branchiostoma belcheri]